MENKVTLKEFSEELVSMLAVCFEGCIRRTEEGADLLLPDGSRFFVAVKRGD